MTRELKLSLILGFSLVLIVTVLISDYLSKARTSRLDPTSPGAPVAAMPPSREELLSKKEAEEERLALAEANAATKTRYDVPQGNAKPPAAVPNQAPTKEFEPIHIGAGGKVPVPVTPAGPKGADEGAQTAPLPPERTHTVGEGDSFYQLAQKYYKDRSLSKQLAIYNGIKPESLKVGSTIKIPSVEVLTGKVTKTPPAAPRNAMGPDGSVDREKLNLASGNGDGLEPLVGTDGLPKASSKPDAKPEAKPESRPESRQSGPRSYTVKKGDTPGHIAARELGSSRRASEIMDLNSGLFSDEYGLKVGMVIKLPAK